MVNDSTSSIRSQKIEHFFNTPVLSENLYAVFDIYCIEKCANYLDNKLKEFNTALPKISSWIINEYLFIPAFSNRDFYAWILKSSHAKEIISKEYLRKIRQNEPEALSLCSKIIARRLQVISNLSIESVLECYLIKQQIKIFNQIEKNAFINPENEKEVHCQLKKLDIYRSIYWIEKKEIQFSNSYSKERYYKILKDTLTDLDNDKLYCWGNVYSNFSKSEIHIPLTFKLPIEFKKEYDFQDYSSVPYVLYCESIIRRHEKTALADLMLNRDFGSELTDYENKVLQFFQLKDPSNFKAVLDDVHSEQIFKYTTYTALTSLVAMLDPLLRSICEQLNHRKGFIINIHSFNISSTYESFKKQCRSNRDKIEFSHFDELEEIFDQIYSKNKGLIRNAIAHLSGIDLYNPLYYFESLYEFVRGAYLILALFFRSESLVISLSLDHDKLTQENIDTINKYKGGFHWYIMNYIHNDVLVYLKDVLFNGDERCLYFFLSEQHSIDFIEKNWALIYPNHVAFKNDVLLLFDHIKQEVNKLDKFTISANKVYTDKEIIEGLKYIGCDKIITTTQAAIKFLLNKVTNSLTHICPSYRQLIIVSTYGVKTLNKHEALLNISTSALLIEKILLSLKQYHQQTGCLSYKIISNGNCIVKYKNMEIESPKNSFVDEKFLQATYLLITGIEHTEALDDYDEFKRILFTLENIRNISAHGGITSFENNYKEIYAFIFFVLYRLMPIK